MKLKQSENDVTKAIIEYLRLKKYRVYKLYNGAIAQRVAGNKIIYKKKDPEMDGVSDLIALREGYPILFIEVKGTNGKPSDDQLEFLRLVNASDVATGLVANNIEDVMMFLATWDLTRNK